MNDDRYSRQTLLKEIGLEGQRRIGESTVVVVGCGALGTHAASLLVRAGIGRILIVDPDTIDVSNLQRQTLFCEEDVGKAKAEVAKRRLTKINSKVSIDGVVDKITVDNVERMLGGATVVIDATDNMEARFVINDACVKLGIPWVYGGAVATAGMVFVTVPDGPCLRCVFSKLPTEGSLPTCDTVGIVNSLPSIIASLEVIEALKIILGEELAPELKVIEAWSGDIQKIGVRKNPECVTCGLHDHYNYDR